MLTKIKNKIKNWLINRKTKDDHNKLVMAIIEWKKRYGKIGIIKREDQ